MIRAFDFHAPTHASFGFGTRSAIPSRVDGRACGVLSSPSVIRKPEIQEVLAEISDNGVEVVQLGSVSPNPKLSEIERALDVARSADIDTVLAVGGGSVVDAAKLLRVSISHDAPARAVLDRIGEVVARGEARRCRLIAVPTTSGTGAEVSRGAIITDDRDGRKRAARGQVLVPDVAIVDPEFSLTLSPERTAETGFDVIAHAAETYLSRASTPLTDVLALAALRETPAALRRAVADGQDRAARETLALHSWVMGYNLAHASTCLPHRLQYPVGSLTDTSHQIGLAALYPAWIDLVAPADPERVGRAIGLLAEDGVDAAPQETIRRFLESVGLSTTLRRLGVEEDQVQALAEAVTGRVDLDPSDPTPSDILTLFQASF